MMMPPQVSGAMTPNAGPPPMKMPPSVKRVEEAPDAGSPPDFKTSDELNEQRCWNCIHWDGEGECTKYNQNTDAMDSCSSFQKEEEADDAKEDGQRESDGQREPEEDAD